MTLNPATLTTAPPLRGATNAHAKEVAAVRLTIPGRPQARDRNSNGEPLAAAHAYLERVRATARELGLGRRGHPHVPHGHTRVNLTLIYTSNRNDLPPTAWPAESIPNADTAATLVLKALTGLAWTHATQANPLVITRRLLTPGECLDRHGSLDGATIIEIED